MPLLQAAPTKGENKLLRNAPASKWCPRPRLLRNTGNGQPAQVRLALPPTRTRPNQPEKVPSEVDPGWYLR